MKIGVASKNELKVNAVIKAYLPIADSAEVIGFAAESGVGEQPINEQTLIGARNRILDVKQKSVGLDRIVSIENGIFREGGQWLDKAVAIIYNPKNDEEYVAFSEAVIFPDEYVEIARQIGFDKITVGKVMADAGYIKDQKDPHLSISGISRQAYLEDTVKKLAEKAEMKQK